MPHLPLAGVRVVGLVGAARAGKDTLAQALLAVVPGAERFAFSDAIATYLRVAGRMSVRDPALLQDCGYRLKQQRPAIWIDALYGTIADRRPPLAVVTGVRFPEEAAFIRAMGGRLVRVMRLDAGGTPHVATDRDPTHPVEAQIDTIPCDREVQIGSGHLEMFAQAAAWLAAWLQTG